MSPRRASNGRKAATLTAVLALGVAGCVGGWVRSRVFDAFEPVAMERRADVESHSATWCGECHEAIYDEWRESRMGQAATNAVFVADWVAPENARSELCFKCHAPLDVQQPRRLSGLVDAVPPIAKGTPNPSYDPALHDEGVTCVVCHVQDGALVGPSDRGAPSSPADGDVHALGKSSVLGSADQCAQCHQFEGVPFTRVNRPVADVVEEWRRWQAAGGSESCIECHMPEVERPSATDAPSRIGRRHTFRGGDDPEFLGEGVQLRTRVSDRLRVELENLAGHRYPTGEPARAVELSVSFVDHAGRGVHTERYWLERIIELPRVRERSDTTLRPHEVRSFELAIPETARGVDVRLRYHRAKNLPHMDEADRPAPSTIIERHVALR